MKLSDAFVGLLLLVLAAAVMVTANGYGSVPGQNIGPGAFPMLIAVLLAACALLLIWRSVRAGTWKPAISPGPWLRLTQQSRAFIVTLGAIVFYVGLADRLGFIVCGFVSVLAMALALRLPPRRALPLALLSTLVLHALFYRVLKVPLPGGLLAGWPW